MRKIFNLADREQYIDSLRKLYQTENGSHEDSNNERDARRRRADILDAMGSDTTENS